MNIDFEEIAQLFDVIEYAAKHGARYSAIIGHASRRLNEIEAGLREPTTVVGGNTTQAPKATPTRRL